MEGGRLRKLQHLCRLPLPRWIQEVSEYVELGSDDLPGPRSMQRPADAMLGASMASRITWAWLIPIALVVTAVLVLAEPLVAAGIGLVAGLSLSGSI